jgi:hypothetical protein
MAYRKTTNYLYSRTGNYSVFAQPPNDDLGLAKMEMKAAGMKNEQIKKAVAQGKLYKLAGKKNRVTSKPNFNNKQQAAIVHQEWNKFVEQALQTGMDAKSYPKRKELYWKYWRYKIKIIARRWSK